jgi:uncharacterized protein (TIGR03437 family)
LGIASLPSRCQVNAITAFSQAYVSHMDAATGNVLGTVLVDGSNLSAAGVALAGGSSVWLAGATSQADTPIMPGALTEAALQPGVMAGAYLGEADFNLNQSSGPQVSCIVDGANEARTAVIAPSQLLTLFGSRLGPATGVAAPNDSTMSLAGVTVTFDGIPAPLLYVSSEQINVAVPASVSPSNSQGNQNFPVVQVSVNGASSSSRLFPVVASNPSLFGDLTGAITSCTVGDITYFGGFTAVAVNADGSANSCLHRATPGSVVSFFVNGLGVDDSYGMITGWSDPIPVAVTMGQWSAEVVNVSSVNPFVWQADVRVPAQVEAAAKGGLFLIPVTMDMNFWNGVAPVGPLSVEPFSPNYTPAGAPLQLSVWVSP